LEGVETKKGESGDEFFPASHLLLLRTWREDLGNGRSEWRARARHVLSGETIFIRSWEDMEAFLSTLEKYPFSLRENYRK
jgi:hypothetical protein